MDWLDLLAVQGALKSLLQHHSSEASVLWRSACFIVHLSHPYMTTGKTIALTRLFSFQFSSVQFSRSVVLLSCVRLFVTPWNAALQASLSITNFRSLLQRIYVESVMLSNHQILCPSLCLLPSIFARIRVFSNESVLHSRWPEYWSFSFSISPSNEYSGLISFRMDWLDLLAIQET